jgi:high-affinity iron transporter
VLGNYLIGLREGLEASLVVSILVAYLVRVGRRDKLRLVGSGVGAALALSVAFGAALTYTSTTLLQSGTSQEAFGGIASLVAVALVTAMIFWMRRTARHLKADLDSRLDAALQVGGLAVALTAFAAVGREGLETALFFWSAVQAAGSTLTPVIGFGLGITTAVVLAWLLYRRSVKLNLAVFFTWTGAALIVVAAGVLGYAIHDLQEGAILGGLNNLAFDVSAQVPPGSWYGALLKGVFNFSPNTTWYQAIAYVGYLVPVLTVFFLAGHKQPAAAPTVASAVTTRPSRTSSVGVSH